MNKDELEALADYDEKLLGMMEKVHSLALYQLEAVKLRIAHHEKLIVLCTGTLALSLSAATAFHAQNTRLSGGRHLLHAWELLMISIALAMISNWLSINGISNLGNWYHWKQLGIHFSVMESSMRKLNAEYAANERAHWDSEAPRFKRSETTARVMIRSGAGVGFAAQGAALWAFASLLFFAKDALMV